MRHAQQTFRLKKENLTRSLQERVDELEAEAQRMAELFSTFYNTAMRSSLHRTEPELALLLEDTATQFLSESVKARDPECQKNTSKKTASAPIQVPDEGLRTSTDAISSADSDIAIFGYQFPSQENRGTAANTRIQGNSRLCASRFDHGYPGSKRYRPSARYDRRVIWQAPLKQVQLDTDYTYSFQEISFSRRLHRYCLEHTYRLFIRPGTDPRTVYRVFRLVSCIADKSKMQPYFENLLRRRAGESLEILSLPFYTIGGAGTHYPRKDGSGKPVFPENMRLPKRILGSLPLSVTGALNQEQSYQGFLDIMGYGGVWFDSYDVETYLKERGIVLDSLSSFVEVEAATARSHLSSSPLVAANTFNYQASDIADNMPTPTDVQEVRILNTTKESQTKVPCEGHLATSHPTPIAEQAAPCNSTAGVEDQINSVHSNTPSFFFDVQRFLERKSKSLLNCLSL